MSRAKAAKQYEYQLPGGIYWEGDNRGGDRTDVSLVECGKGEPSNPYTFMLTITTGNGSYNLCGLLPEDVKRLGDWLRQTADADNR